MSLHTCCGKELWVACVVGTVVVAVEPGMGEGRCVAAGGSVGVLGEFPEGALPLGGTAPATPPTTTALPLPLPTALALADGNGGGSSSTSSLGIPAT